MTCFTINTQLQSYQNFYLNNPYFFSIIFFIFLFAIYFTIIRPNQQRIKKHDRFIHEINVGDEVITNGGLIGKIVKLIDENYVLLSVNKDTEIILKKNHILKKAPKDLIKLI